MLLHQRFDAPDPRAFELFCARRRRPLGQSAVDSICDPSIAATTSVADALALVTALPSVGTTGATRSEEPLGTTTTRTRTTIRERLALLLLPASRMPVTGRDMLVTSFKQLDHVFPPSRRASCGEGVVSSGASQASQGTKQQPKQAAATGFRPSRPAAHTQERGSKCHETFAGRSIFLLSSQ